MLCRKCGKEIHHKVHCPHCRCDNHYEHENVPAHLAFIETLFDGPLKTDAAEVNTERTDAAATSFDSGQNEQHRTFGPGVSGQPGQRPAGILRRRTDAGTVYDDLDEEMDEMLRKKYGIAVNILTAVACVCCLCIGFIAGGIVERGQMASERDEASDIQGSLKDTSDTAMEDTANMFSSPFRIESDASGEYLMVNLPVGFGNYWYDFSDLADQIGADLLIQGTYQQQELVDNNSVIQTFTLKLPLEKVEITETADEDTDAANADDSNSDVNNAGNNNSDAANADNNNSDAANADNNNTDANNADNNNTDANNADAKNNTAPANNTSASESETAADNRHGRDNAAAVGF